jgi:hypothetical protein
VVVRWIAALGAALVRWLHPLRIPAGDWPFWPQSIDPGMGGRKREEEAAAEASVGPAGNLRPSKQEALITPLASLA